MRMFQRATGKGNAANINAVEGVGTDVSTRDREGQRGQPSRWNHLVKLIILVGFPHGASAQRQDARSSSGPAIIHTSNPL